MSKIPGMKVAVIIPARYGSTRFKGKSLALLAGKPMIQRVYENSARAQHVTDVCVATDDKRIVDAVSGFGGRAVMTSSENRTGTDRVAEVAMAIGLSPGDIVVNVQGDQPMVRPAHIEAVVQPFIAESDLDMTTLAYAITRPEEIHDPKDVKVTFDNNAFALYFSRATIPYDRDGDVRFDTYKHLGIYAYTRQFLDLFRALPEGNLEKIEKLEQLRVLENGFRIKVAITAFDSPEVDLPEDIPRIEALLDKA
jgi:3-deoxy-manno-octulosonate cytidylyltransferase (CMP-KDO synthetase)